MRDHYVYIRHRNAADGPLGRWRGLTRRSQRRPLVKENYFLCHENEFIQNRRAFLLIALVLPIMKDIRIRHDRAGLSNKCDGLFSRLVGGGTFILQSGIPLTLAPIP